MKAFDKVPHRRLAHKVNKYGIKNNVLGWITNFLSNRTQVVKVGNCNSEVRNVTSGIPQGSVLGPLLFVIYINDLPEVVSENSYVYLFADDAKVFREIKTHQDHIILQEDINKLMVWSNKWLLKFHPDKCVSMKITHKLNHVCTESYVMGNHKLKESKCEKDIGVSIDNNLKFDIHVNNCVNKANRVLAVTRRTFECWNDNIFRMIFKGLVRPHLEYAAPIWSPYFDKYKDQIENVQRRATKLVPGLSQLSYPERLKKLKMPTLSYRRARGDMIQVYKLTTDHKEGYDKSLPCMLNYNKDDRRGHSKKLSMPGVNKDVRKYFFTNRIIEMWNDLPEKAVSAKTIVNFEKELDEYWKNQKMKYDDHLAKIAVKKPLRYCEY